MAWVKWIVSEYFWRDLGIRTLTILRLSVGVTGEREGGRAVLLAGERLGGRVGRSIGRDILIYDTWL